MPDLDKSETDVNSDNQYEGGNHFFPALTFAHLARAAALIRASPAAEMWRLGLALLVVELPFCLAHLALCAEAIRLRAAADMIRPERDALRMFPLIEVRASIAASRRSRSCLSSLIIASRFAMAGDCSRLDADETASGAALAAMGTALIMRIAGSCQATIVPHSGIGIRRVIPSVLLGCGQCGVWQTFLMMS
jgi:hypothetical protein